MLLPTVTVMVELPDPGAGIGSGLKLTVVPDGTPEAERVTALLKPPLMVVVIVTVPWLPCWMVRDAGEAEIVKLGRLKAVAVVNATNNTEVSRQSRRAKGPSAGVLFIDIVLLSAAKNSG